MTKRKRAPRKLSDVVAESVGTLRTEGMMTVSTPAPTPVVPSEADSPDDAVSAYSMVREKRGWVVTRYLLPPNVAADHVYDQRPPDTKALAMARIEEALRRDDR